MHYRIQEKDLWGEIMNIRIRTVDDLNSYHYTTISRSDVKESEYENRPYEETSWSFNQTISLNRHSPDPILSGIEAWLHGYLPFRGKYQEEAIFTLSIGKGGFVVLFEKRAIRYYLNGKAYNKATIYMALSRIIYKSCFDDKPAILFVALNKYLNIPDNVSHALENRAAYFWHSKMRRVNVSLNVQMISDTKCALEISDGIWGEISIKELARTIAHILDFRGKVIWDTDKPNGQHRKPSDNAAFLALSNMVYTPLDEALKKTCEWFIMNYPNVRGV